MNLEHYVTKEDYAVWAGPDWPSYTAFLAGITSPDSFIHNEITEFRQNYIQQGEKFPINTATACQSKWTWSTIYLNQLATASCHRVKPVPIDPADFDNFHNIPKKIADRKLMLEGNWPRGGCEYCGDIERAGGWSDRQHNLEIRGLTPPELLTDPTATHVSPRIVEIFAQNTCNLSCLYCNGNLSSKIEQENIKHGEFNLNGVQIPVINTPTVAAQEYFDQFVSWLDRNVHSLKRLHLLGGETFIQHELMTTVLDILERVPNPDLQFCVFSNLNVPDSAWDRYILRIQDLQQRGHIRVFDLTASIDCWGPEQEFVRSGLDLQRFEQRLEWAVQQGPWIHVNCNQTITAMTVRTMPELIEKINYYSQYKQIGHYFQYYTGPHMFQHPKTFAWDFWAQDFNRIINTMTDPEALQRMTGMQQLLMQHRRHNYNDIHKLHTYLDEIDRRRNTNWRNLFSYLDIKT
jgi:MoaA/NifB/PqqE/SkfB family radical SAM enzyme